MASACLRAGHSTHGMTHHVPCPMVMRQWQRQVTGKAACPDAAVPVLC
jgi:hypothetical protein